VEPKSRRQSNSTILNKIKLLHVLLEHLTKTWNWTKTLCIYVCALWLKNVSTHYWSCTILAQKSQDSCTLLIVTTHHQSSHEENIWQRASTRTGTRKGELKID
jgi:hypothetical protein